MAAAALGLGSAMVTKEVAQVIPRLCLAAGVKPRAPSPWPSRRACPLRPIVTHISPTTSLLRSDSTDNEVFLLGTAHVSEASTQEVSEIIRVVRPGTVFVELDAARAAGLRSRGGAGGEDAAGSARSFDLSNLGSHPLLRGLGGADPGTAFGRILDAAPALLERVGWFSRLGGEMRAALEEADRIGARCVYGDLDFGETKEGLKSVAGDVLKNPSQLMNVPAPPIEVKDIFGELVSGRGDPKELVEKIKSRDRAKQITAYMKQAFPSIYDVIVTKRDAHMAKMLREHCSNGKVVAVVGIAHVEGIEREWEDLGGRS